MTTEKHDPWALLAEIHELQPWLSQDADLAARVEDALASRDKLPCSCGQPYPCMKGCPDCCHSQGYLDYCQGDRHAGRQDSAKDVVEWTKVALEDDYAYAQPSSDTYVTTTRLDGQWQWSARRVQGCSGPCATEVEACRAATAAARGLK